MAHHHEDHARHARHAHDGQRTSHVGVRATGLSAVALLIAAAIVVGFPDVAAAGLEWRDIAQLQPADEPDTAYQLGRIVGRLLVPGLIVFFVVRAIRRRRRRSQDVVERPLPKIEPTTVD